MAVPVIAQEDPEPPAALPLWLQQHIITGSAASADRVGGSATYLESETLTIHHDSDVMRILRRVPGVNLQEEDGFGLRPNIGLRGTGLDRSGKITLMEDGVLMAPAPYSAPSAYYFPNVARMHAVEIIKGPASVLYAPRTQGGSINLISTPVPQSPSLHISTQGGQFGSGRVIARAGGRHRADDLVLGGLVEVLYDRATGFKQLDGGGDTGFEIRDYLVKLLARAQEDADWQWEAEIKAQAGNQISNETYLGLTAADFAVAPYRRYAASSKDRFTSDHTELSGRVSLSHGSWKTSLLAYRTDFARNWRKLEQIGGTGVRTILNDPVGNALLYQIVTGTIDTVNMDINGDTVIDNTDKLRIRNNNRTYYAHGVQWVGSADLSTGPVRHGPQLGFRWHADQIDRFQWWDYYDVADGVLVIDDTDPPGTESNRLGQAESFAIFVTDTLTWRGLSLSPGLRYEQIRTRESRWANDDPRRLRDPARQRSNVIDIVVPGIGITYAPNAHWSLLAGVHRGFSPPGPGASEGTRPEDAVNYEMGFRWNSGKLVPDSDIEISLIGYISDYNNILGTCTVSGAGNCSEADVANSTQYNGDAATTAGLELALGGGWDLTAFGRPGLGNLAWSLAYTYTAARFDSSFDSDFWGEVAAGDALPYIPEHQLTMNLGLRGEWPSRNQTWQLDLGLNWVDQTRSQAGSGAIAADQLVDGRAVIDLAARYILSRQVTIFVRAKNLLNATYVVARRPSGLRPGLPLQFLGGIDIKF